MEKKLYVYSGKCRKGKCGDATPLKDSVSGKDLFVGDIVITSSINEFGININHGLTVVVCDKWTSYSDGTHVEKDGDVVCFVMGIKNVDFMGKDSDKWIVQRVKIFSDVIDGEHWTDYGFNYKAE